MSVFISALGGAAAQFFDGSGNPLSGGLLYSYAAGTTTPQATYTSSAGSTAHTNPIVLDSAGRVSSGEIWLTEGLNYKFVLRDSAGALINTYDNIIGINDPSSANSALTAFEALLAGATGSSLVGFKQTSASAVSTTVQAKLAQTLSVLDFGADPTGAADSTTAIQNAIDYAQSKNGGIILFPWGTYKISAQINITKSNVILQGYGADGIHDGGTGAFPATMIVWDGGVYAGSMFSFYTVQNVANAKINGVGLNNMYLDCSGTCSGGINIISINNGRFDHINILHPTYVGVVVTNYLAGQIAEPADSQLNIFSNITVRCLDLPTCINGNGFILASNAPGTAGGNTSFNTYLYCQGQFIDGTAFLLTDADNNNLISCRAFISGTGKGIDVQGYGDSNYFYNFSCGGFPSKIFIRGTASGFGIDSVNNCFLFPDQGNGTTYPQIDVGCKIYWTGSDGTTVKSRNTQTVITDSTSTISAAQSNLGLASLIIDNRSAAGFRITDGTNLWGINQTGVNGDLRWSCANGSSKVDFNNNVFNNAFSYFPNAPTTASAANVFVDNADNNRLHRVTSSIKYKTNIETLEHQYSDALLQARPVWYRSKSKVDNKAWSWYGFIAEELAQIDPRLVHWSYADDCYDIVETVEKDGSTIKTKVLKDNAQLTPESVQYERISVLLLDLVQRQQKDIDDLKAKFSNLEQGA
jgi:hypothetical protein